ncbi:hypothetical protein ACIBI9_31270 [Nonomuraea sp. NPDC050451]|uniref:hypothetical protein n=1 Tax=Nonomuraea sp. NPDC050451 TaxID=3364364 RepID=UPI0037B63DC7
MLEGLFIDNKGPYAYEMRDETSHIEGYSLSSPQPDPAWSHVDTQGHFHAFNLENGGLALPTLIYNEYGVPHCAICNEFVEPHFLAGGITHESIPGPKRVSITVPRYNRDVNHGDRVSFYTREMFGIAKVTGFHFIGTFDGKSVCLDLACEFIVKRNNDL